MTISVRWLPRVPAFIMVGTLALFCGVMLAIGNRRAALTVVVVGTYPALLFALNSTHLSARKGVLEKWIGPIPVPFAASRQRINASDIEGFSCQLVSAIVGRGGRAEFYVVSASTKLGHKPIPLLDAYRREADAQEAVRALTAWLKLSKS